MGTKHTPGPWTVDPKRSLRVIAPGDETVASCGTSDLIRDSWEANSRLIAHAPDLLGFLEDLVEYSGIYGAETLEAAKELIASAKGETNA